MKIIDNFLSTDKFSKLQSAVMSNGFPWFYTQYVSLPPGDHSIKDKNAVETSGWYHLLYDKTDGSGSRFYDIFLDFFIELENRLGYEKSQLLRARLSLKTPKPNFTKENYNLPHIDYNFPHVVLLYYMNDSDGDTRMFNEFFKEYPGPTNFTIQQTIKPIANRLVIFDGLQYHTAANPIDSDRRIIFNLNLLP
jgi:hypothetical protein